MVALIFSLLFCFGCLSKLSNSEGVSGMHFKVAMLEMVPFTQFKSHEEGNLHNASNGGKYSENNAKYRGFMPTLIEEVLRNISNVTYEIYLVPDGKFGRKFANGTWVGLIGEIVEKRANIAAGPLTITNERLEVVKFSFPFMAANIVPIMKRPSKAGGKLAFRHIKEMTEAAGKGKLTYGIVKGGSTETMLKESNYALYRGMYEQMTHMERQGLNPFAATYQEAMERIRNGSKYVFLGEDTALGYQAGKEPCDLFLWGREMLNTAFYGLAFPKDIPDKILDAINQRIIELQRSGTMKLIKDRWWENKCEYQRPKLCVCHDPDDEDNQLHRSRNATNSEESGESKEQI